jgi:hypothetical protein
MQLQALTYGCPKLFMTSLHWQLICWGLIGSQNLLPLGFLKLQILLIKFW